jgi:hypothetical protein
MKKFESIKQNQGIVNNDTVKYVEIKPTNQA